MSGHGSEPESMAENQFDLFDRVKKELVNFRKDGPDRKTRTHSQRRIERVEQLRTEFTNNHRQLLVLGLSREDDYFKQNILDTFEEEFLNAFAVINEKLLELYPPEAVLAPVVQPNANGQPMAPIVIQQNNIDRLPELKVPTFDGSYVDWPTFHDTFLQIHDNQRATPQQKFRYLQSSIAYWIFNYHGRKLRICVAGTNQTLQS